MNRISKEGRSRIMAAIRSSGNRTTEKRLRFALVSVGISGWHVQDHTLPGTPDFVFPQEKLAIFVHGCFWHGCPFGYRKPRTSRKYWDNKLNGNIARDKRVSGQLRRKGWAVLVVWEHSLTEPKRVVMRIDRALQRLRDK